MANARGVQKTNESKKLAETDQIVAKFSVWFWFDSGSVLNF